LLRLLLFTQIFAIFNHFDTSTQENGQISPMISQSVLEEVYNLLYDELVVDHMLVPVFFFFVLSQHFSDTANVTALVSWEWFSGANYHCRDSELYT
jgi:hypothetical protein